MTLIPADSPATQSRRGFVANVAMLSGLVAGYGLGVLHFFRYLVPLRSQHGRREMFVGTLGGFPIGATITARDPQGQGIIITRTVGHDDDPAKQFRALSTKCPHLGCQVHWEAGKQRFRCPCHEGIFDKNGKAISGPPADEGKNLIEYEVRVDRDTGSIYVMVAPEPGYGA
jgi:Rieske Fe-S protein